MRFRNNAKTGVLISIFLSIIAIFLILVVNTVPNVAVNTLNTVDKLRYYSGNNQIPTPIWKNICYIIIGILLILETIVNFVMCRCNHCGKHLWFMNIFMMYCPYCSKSLDTPKDK